MNAYWEWPGASRHPDRVLLVSCYRGDKIYGLGHVMGPRGSGSSREDIVVAGLPESTSDGACYAITAKYDGPKDACWERFPGACYAGAGEDIEILGFKRVGEVTEIPNSQYNILLEYAYATEYQVAGR